MARSVESIDGNNRFRSAERLGFGKPPVPFLEDPLLARAIPAASVAESGSSRHSGQIPIDLTSTSDAIQERL
jgi:hypothetical protein